MRFAQHLAEAVRVGRGPNRALGGFQGNGVALDTESAQHQVRFHTEVHQLQRHVENASLGATGGEQVLDHIAGLDRLMVGQDQQFLDLLEFETDPRFGYEFGDPDHPGEVIAQLVADHTDGLRPGRLQLGEPAFDRGDHAGDHADYEHHAGGTSDDGLRIPRHGGEHDRDRKDERVDE
jgi:hypothetical protein